MTDYCHLDGVEFSVASELRLTTERFISLLRPDTYFGMPKTEAPREQDWSIEGRMDDGLWHRYRRAWFSVRGHWLQARILWAIGPAGGQGIYTGPILATSGTWDETEPHSARATAEKRGRR